MLRFLFFMTRSGPSVSGTSVVAVRFKDGVVIAADTLGALPLLSTRPYSRTRP